MKKLLITITLATVAFASTLSAQDIKIKKGKVTMTEAQYEELKKQAEANKQATAKINELEKDLSILKKQTQMPPMTNYIDSASYAIGRDLFMSWNMQQLGLNHKIVAQSILDCDAGKNKWTDQIAQPILSRFQSEFEKRQKAQVEQNIIEGKQFLVENAMSKSVYTTESGLQYRIREKGTGPKPSLNAGSKKGADVVKVHYTGKLLNGKVFDSSIERGTPLEFPIDRVIAGWTEALQLMPVGSKWTLYIPYNLAYGEQSTGEIPGGSTLIFEVELLEIIKK